MCAKLVQSCLTLCDSAECNLPGSSTDGIVQARIGEWVVISFPRDLPGTGMDPASPALAGGFFTTSSTWEAQFAFYSVYLCFLMMKETLLGAVVYSSCMLFCLRQWAVK